MPHPLMNNLKTDKIRQSIIGLALGVVVIAIFSPLIGTSSHAPEQIKFDSELIQISKRETQPLVEEQPTIAQSQLDDNAHLYAYFAMHKTALSQKQVEAIINNTPRLTVVLNHVGQTRSMTARILEKLPQDVTIGLSPYIRNHNEVATQIHDYGFETWMDLSAITLNVKTDYGPMALNPVNNFDNNIKLLSDQLNNKDKLVGVILPNHALVTETPRLWKDIVTDLFAQGYGILDNTKNITKPALYFHDEKRAPYIKGDKTITDALTLDELKTVLVKTRKDVIDQGNLIITIPISTPAHLDILVQWVESLPQDNITLVPLSGQAKL